MLIDPITLKKEKDKARDLRNTTWWKRKRSNGLCHYCGNKFPVAQLTMDHVIPLARGGRSVKDNLVPSCKDCNNRKKNLIPAEWTEYLERLQRDADPRSADTMPEDTQKNPGES